jgi:hypothetical protein
MDSNLLMLSFLFGMIGMAMCMYGKKSSRFVPMGVGAALMVVPYFITSALVMLLVCSGLLTLPWIVREG